MIQRCSSCSPLDGAPAAHVRARLRGCSVHRAVPMANCGTRETRASAMRAFLTPRPLHRWTLRELTQPGVELHRFDQTSPTCLARPQMSAKCGGAIRFELTIGEADQIVAWAHGLRHPAPWLLARTRTARMCALRGSPLRARQDRGQQLDAMTRSRSGSAERGASSRRAWLLPRPGIAVLRHPTEDNEQRSRLFCVGAPPSPWRRTVQ